VIGGSGALLILWGGTFLSSEQLAIWGIPIFLSGIALIAIGLLPYRRLVQLQLKPHEIHYDGTTLVFCKQGLPLLKICESSIEKIAYLEKKHLYGLGIWLKRPIEQKVKMLQQPRRRLVSFFRHNLFEGCDLFLPYFSARTYLELTTLLG
jgi:hypothetical protein